MASLYRLTNTAIAAHCCLRTKSPSTYVAFLPNYLTNRSINLYATADGAASPSPLPPSTTTALRATKFLGLQTSINGLMSSSYNNACQLMRGELHQQQQQRFHHQQQQQYRNFSSLQTPMQRQSSRLVHQNAMAPVKNNHRNISSKDITKNMTLYTSTPFKGEVDPKTLQFKKAGENPLVLMMSWLMAKQKHLRKYAEIYTELGFDVMVVHITPWQLLWPVKGTQIVAAETIKFLENNMKYSPIVVHGFSVGAYQFGEIMLQMSRDMARYQQILDRIACQIWDSAADITQIPVGVPKSIFPKNPRMQSALRNYTLYHLKTFHNQATIHYMRSSQMFHSTILKKPALFFVADNDLIGPPSSNNAVRENWERANINVTFKRWERSLHAAHMIKHRDEYLELLFKFLESSGVLETVKAKQRAKL